jgi:hypothetical protein
VDNREPTPEVIGAALKRAQQLIAEKKLHINEALAAATTSAQCRGFMGFKVFSESRNAVVGILGPDVSYEVFCTEAKPQAQIAALESAYLVVMS